MYKDTDTQKDKKQENNYVANMHFHSLLFFNIHIITLKNFYSES